MTIEENVRSSQPEQEENFEVHYEEKTEEKKFDPASMATPQRAAPPKDSGASPDLNAESDVLEKEYQLGR